MNNFKSIVLIPKDGYHLVLNDVFIFTQEELDKRDKEKWISVEEKLPLIWGDFLVCTGDWVGSCHYDGKFYDYSVSKMRAESRYELPVKFWQPLPEPPK